MKKRILSLFVAVAIALLTPSLVVAETTNNPMMLVHAYNPMPVTSPAGVMNSAVRARVDNWTNTQQMKLVCVEANKAGMNNHLGCLNVSLMPKMSTNGDWAREFDAPVTGLSSGSYKIMYNYQDDQGRWFPVTAIDGTAVNTTITR